MTAGLHNNLIPRVSPFEHPLPIPHPLKQPEEREISLTPFLFKLLLYILSVSDAYAQYSKVPAERAVKVPDQLTMEQAASTLWQGFTAHAFARSSYPIKAGDKILVHAAAGGVGNLIIQIAKNAGRYHYRI